MKQLTGISLISFVVFATCVRGQSSKTIEPIVNDNAVAVFYANLTKVNSAELNEFLGRHLGGTLIAKHTTDIFSQLIDPLKAVAAKELFIVMYADRHYPEFAIAAPLSKSAKPGDITKVFRKISGNPITRINGLIVMSSDRVRKSWKPKIAIGPKLIKAFNTVTGADIQVAIVPGITAWRQMLGRAPRQLPRELDSIKTLNLLNGFRWAVVGVTLKPKFAVRVIVQSTNSESAKLLHKFAAKAAPFADGQRRDLTFGPLTPLYRLLSPNVVKSRVLGGADQPAIIEYLRNIAAPIRDFENRQSTLYNLLNLNTLLHTYEDRHGKLPAVANFDNKGRPLLSWRVHILPFLGEKNLYKEFRLNEPWNSAHNRKAIQKIPNSYRSPLSKAKPGMTTYLAVVGKGTILGKGFLTLKQVDMSDGTANTVWIVEADDIMAVPWTKPTDLSIDVKDLHRTLGNNGKNAFHAAFADGAVRSMPRSISAEKLRWLFRYNDGKVIELPERDVP